jgi:hypothetical protein
MISHSCASIVPILLIKETQKAEGFGFVSFEAGMDEICIDNLSFE